MNGPFHSPVVQMRSLRTDWKKGVSMWWGVGGDEENEVFSDVLLRSRRYRWLLTGCFLELSLNTSYFGVFIYLLI